MLLAYAARKEVRSALREELMTEARSEYLEALMLSFVPSGLCPVTPRSCLQCIDGRIDVAAWKCCIRGKLDAAHVDTPVESAAAMRQLIFSNSVAACSYMLSKWDSGWQLPCASRAIQQVYRCGVALPNCRIATHSSSRKCTPAMMSDNGNQHSRLQCVKSLVSKQLIRKSG